MEKVTRVWSAGVPTSRMTGGRQEASAGEGAARQAKGQCEKQEQQQRRRRAVKWMEWIKVEG